jgi:hypothetical protein
MTRRRDCKPSWRRRRSRETRRCAFPGGGEVVLQPRESLPTDSMRVIWASLERRPAHPILCFHRQRYSLFASPRPELPEPPPTVANRNVTERRDRNALERRDRNGPLNEGQIPIFRGVGVALWYGRQSWRGKSAGVSNRPRELPPHSKSNNPTIATPHPCRGLCVLSQHPPCL